MRLRPIILAAVLTATVVLSGCGGGSGSDGSASDGGTATTTTKADGGSSSDQKKVEIADFAFDPADLEVKVGDTVTFTNSDDATHTATAEDGDPTMFDTGDIKSGDDAGVTFDEAGDYEYECSIHDYMKGTIHVMG